MKGVVLFLALVIMASSAIAQEGPFVQPLLQSSGDPCPDSTVVDPIGPPSVVAVPAEDSTAVDYVPPDAGAPGSLREKQENMDRRAMRRDRSAVRLGIGIPLGLFSGIWISF